MIDTPSSNLLSELEQPFDAVLHIDKCGLKGALFEEAETPPPIALLGKKKARRKSADLVSWLKGRGRRNSLSEWVEHAVVEDNVLWDGDLLSDDYDWAVCLVTYLRDNGTPNTERPALARRVSAMWHLSQEEAATVATQAKGPMLLGKKCPSKQNQDCRRGGNKATSRQDTPPQGTVARRLELLKRWLSLVSSLVMVALATGTIVALILPNEGRTTTTIVSTIAVLIAVVTICHWPLISVAEDVANWAARGIATVKVSVLETIDHLVGSRIVMSR